MIKCDICKLDVEEVEEVASIFRRNGIKGYYDPVKHACKDCNKFLNNIIPDIDKTVEQALKNLLDKQKDNWIKNIYYKFWKSKGN